MSGVHSSGNHFDPVLPCVQPVIEQNSLQISMESNRECLERRLQLRRTLPELVSQGIYPKLNTPLAFAEQCRQLEQAKKRDQLQKKLKHRPDRKCLVQHHILEDTNPMVDRSLQDKQRLLKKSKLQDNLNDLISHRPGPLDLLSKNILMLDDDSSTHPLSDDVGQGTDNEESFLALAEQCFQLEQANKLTNDQLEKKLMHGSDQQHFLQDHFLENTDAIINGPLQDKSGVNKFSELKNNMDFFLSNQMSIPLNFLNEDSSSLSVSSDTVGPNTDNEEGLFADSVGNFNSFFPTSFDSGSFDSPFISQSDEPSKYSSTSSFEETQLQTFSPSSSTQDFYGQQIRESDLAVASRTSVAVILPKTLDASSSSTLGFQQLQQLTSSCYIPPAPDITALLAGKQLQNGNAVSSISFNFPVVTQATMVSTATEYRQLKSQKKMRTKSVSKPKQIKFHEYKGPPSVVKANQQAAALKNKQTQPHYEILKLQQEQLMKWQVAPKSNLEKPVILSHISPKLQNLPELGCSDLNNTMVISKQVKMLDMMNTSSSNAGKSQQIARIPCPTIIPQLSSGSADFQNVPKKSHVQLASMKVTELRDECRKLNLSCSGSKHQLVERLRLYRSNSSNVLMPLFVEPQPGCRVSSSLTSAQVLPMDVEASLNNIPTSSTMATMILNSLVTNSKVNFSPHGMLSSKSFSNSGYEHGCFMAESEPFSTQEQQQVKIENDKQFMSPEEKIAELERNLKQSQEQCKQAQDELKLRKEELLELTFSLVKSSNVVSQSAKNNLLLNLGVDHLKGDLTEQLLTILANQNQNATAKISHANLPILNQQIPPPCPLPFLKQFFEQQNTAINSEQNSLLFTIPSNNTPHQQNVHRQQNLQQQPNVHQQQFYLNQNLSVLSNNTFNFSNTNGKSQQFAPTKIENSNLALFGQVQSPRERNVFQNEVVGTSTPVLRSSSSSVSLNNGFNATALLTHKNSGLSSIGPKNVNQRLSQNLNGNSFDSMLKLWSMQNQNNKNQQQQQQEHSDRATIEDVLDVLSTKSDFQISELVGSDMFVPSQQHNNNNMDIFNTLDANDQSMSNTVAYDMSFPFMMDSTDETEPHRQFAESSNQPVSDASIKNDVSCEFIMQTQQPGLELMDIFPCDDVTSCESSFQTLVDQQRPNRSLPDYANSINSSRYVNSNTAKQQSLAGNFVDQWNNLDLSTSQLLQTSNNNNLLFNKIFTTDPVSK